MKKLRLKHTEGPGRDHTERVVELKEAVQVLKGLSRASIRSNDQEKESNVISTKLGTALGKDPVQARGLEALNFMHCKTVAPHC